jgi:hypothetical protein
VLVDRPGVARSHREAPEIDGIVMVSRSLAVGEIVDVDIVDALGPDLIADGADFESDDESPSHRLEEGGH